jgi:hypothetical protein
MKKLSNYKGQGTIEYLIIVAIVIVIALVVVGILLSINPGTGVAERTSKIEWSSTEPWAITEWDANTTHLTVVLKNNTAGSLTFNEIDIAGNDNTDSKEVPAGGVITRHIAKSCSGTYSYDSVTISYDTSSITGREQYGSSPIVGTCSQVN